GVLRRLLIALAAPIRVGRSGAARGAAVIADRPGAALIPLLRGRGSGAGGARGVMPLLLRRPTPHASERIAPLALPPPRLRTPSRGLIRRGLRGPRCRLVSPRTIQPIGETTQDREFAGKLPDRIRLQYP